MTENNLFRSLTILPKFVIRFLETVPFFVEKDHLPYSASNTRLEMDIYDNNYYYVLAPRVGGIER